MRTDLAIFGTPPLFTKPLHVGRPNIGDAQAMMRHLAEIFDRRWFTNDGPTVQEFEAQIANYVGVKHCVSMCNATIALEIAIRATGLTGEVILPSFTFIATAHALAWQGIEPIFADVDPATHNVDPSSVRSKITARTSGIIGVHLWGRPCDTDALSSIAAEHQVRLIYDAAHAFGCSRSGTMIGNFGDCEVFSFHATKFLNSFEGGAVVTNDDDLAAKMRLMRNFGFAGYDNVVYLGTNGKLTEICAAMGLTSLQHVDDLISANRANYRAYGAALADAPGISLLRYNDAERNNYQYVVVEVDTSAPLTRNEIVAVLHAENILARKYFWPGCHRMEPYRSSRPPHQHPLPNTEYVADSVVVLPTGQATTAADIEAVVVTLRVALNRASEVRNALRTSATAT